MSKTYEETLALMEDFANGTIQLHKLSDSDLSNIIVALEKQVLFEKQFKQTHYNQSFLCNACLYSNENDSRCDACNGSGSKWDPKNKEKYEENPQEFMKNLILACSR